MASIEKLHIPYGANSEGELVSPSDAEKNKEYFCPTCKEKLILRKGDIKIPHYSHNNNTNCSNETILHKIAKGLIIQAIKEFKKEKGSQPEIKRNCLICDSELMQKLPEKVTHAVEEIRLKSGFIVDIGLYNEDTLEAAIEIYVTHRVDQEKMGCIEIPWIELNAKDLISDKITWIPIYDNFKSFVCKECRNRLNKYNVKIMELSDRYKLNINTEKYHCGIVNCWKCGNEIPVFDIGIENEDYYPKTVMRKFSNTKREEYLANTCPICKSLQGEFFLYSEPDGPFFALDYINKKNSNLSDDMLINLAIANKYYDEKSYED